MGVTDMAKHRVEGLSAPMESSAVIDALFQSLPPAGSYWSPADRQVWIDLLTGALKLAYKDAPQPETP